MGPHGDQGAPTNQPPGPRTRTLDPCALHAQLTCSVPDKRSTHCNNGRKCQTQPPHDAHGTPLDSPQAPRAQPWRPRCPSRCTSTPLHTTTPSGSDATRRAAPHDAAKAARHDEARTKAPCVCNRCAAWPTHAAPTSLGAAQRRRIGEASRAPGCIETVPAARQPPRLPACQDRGAPPRVRQCAKLLQRWARPRCHPPTDPTDGWVATHRHPPPRPRRRPAHSTSAPETPPSANRPKEKESMLQRQRRRRRLGRPGARPPHLTGRRAQSVEQRRAFSSPACARERLSAHGPEQRKGNGRRPHALSGAARRSGRSGGEQGVNKGREQGRRAHRAAALSKRGCGQWSAGVPKLPLTSERARSANTKRWASRTRVTRVSRRRPTRAAGRRRVSGSGVVGQRARETRGGGGGGGTLRGMQRPPRQASRRRRREGWAAEATTRPMFTLVTHTRTHWSCFRGSFNLASIIHPTSQRLRGRKAEGSRAGARRAEGGRGFRARPPPPKPA